MLPPAKGVLSSTTQAINPRAVGNPPLGELAPHQTKQKCPAAARSTTIFDFWVYFHEKNKKSSMKVIYVYGSKILLPRKCFLLTPTKVCFTYSHESLSTFFKVKFYSAKVFFTSMEVKVYLYFHGSFLFPCKLFYFQVVKLRVYSFSASIEVKH